MLTDTEMLTTLRQHPLLAGLAEGTFQEVCRLAIQRRLETGECLLHQGKPADRFYVLIQGQMKLSRVLTEGQEKRSYAHEIVVLAPEDEMVMGQ